MEQMHIYRMRGLVAALTAARELDRESKDLLVGMGLMLLIRGDDSEDWYLFGNLDNPSAADTSRVIAILSQDGSLSNYSFDQVLNHPRRMFAGTGTFNDVLFSLEALAHSDEKLQGDLRRTVDAFKPIAGSTNN